MSEITMNNIQSEDKGDESSGLQEIFDNCPYPMLIITNGVYVEANEAAFNIFKAKKREDIIGKPPDILSPSTQPDGLSSNDKARDIIIRALKGSHEVFEWQHSTLEGKPFFARVNLKSFLYNNTLSIMVAFEDITLQKEREIELETSKMNMQTIFNSTPYAMLVITDGVFVEANISALTLFGARLKEDIIGKPPSILSPKNQPDGTPSDTVALKYLKNAIDGATESFDWVHQKFDGRLLDCRVILARIKYNGKDSLITVIQDLTEQRKQEREIIRLNQKADWIIDNNPALMFVVGKELEIKKANEAWSKTSGYSIEQILQMKITDFSVSEREGGSLKDALLTLKTISGNFKMEAPNGTFYFRYFYVPMVSESGEVDEILAVYFDETNIKKLQQKLDTNIDEIASALKELALKNLTISVQVHPEDPLAIVKNNLNLMTSNLRTVLKVILSDTESLDRSIKDISNNTKDLAEASTSAAVASEKAAADISEQKKELEDIGRDVSDMSASIEEIAAGALEVRDITIQVAKSGSEAQALGNDATQQMKVVEEVSKVSVEQIRDLNNQMKEIGKIVRLISDIASQTNLLALNAAIEAARAGDAGRGFAVVAGEVKNLAGESRDATRNIEEVITRLMDGSNKTALSIENAYNAIVAGITAVKTTIQGLDQIVHDTGIASGSISDISKATESQAKATNRVNQSIEMVRGTISANLVQMSTLAANSEESSAATEEIASATSIITDMIEQLRNKINEFRL